MQNYHSLMLKCLQHGKHTSNRTGVGTHSLLGEQLRYNLVEAFPAVTTKRLAWKAVVSELLWFMEGSTKDSRLSVILYGETGKKTIWTDNAQHQGKALGYDGDELGPVYGSQWRNFGGVDQLENLRTMLKEEPESRRMIMSAWNPEQLEEMALPPCHVMSQYVVQDGKLNCIVTQRSCDLFLGVPFNLASYALLTHILAADAGLHVGELIWNGGDVHIYDTHVVAAYEQLSRFPKLGPVLTFNKKDSIYDYNVNDFTLDEYYPYDPIRVDMVV